MGNATTRMLKRIKNETDDFDEMIDKCFSKFDKNDDGVLSLEEFEVLIEEVGAYFSELVAKSGSKCVSSRFVSLASCLGVGDLAFQTSSNSRTDTTALAKGEVGLPYLQTAALAVAVVTEMRGPAKQRDSFCWRSHLPYTPSNTSQIFHSCHIEMLLAMLTFHTIKHFSDISFLPHWSVAIADPSAPVGHD